MADGDFYLDMGKNDKPFSPGSQPAVDMLESMMPAEKAQAVPYVLIWEIDPNTGKPCHGVDGQPLHPLSIATVSPPRFGMAVTAENDNADIRRFRERPPVSLERVVVKSQNPRGAISYRTIELAFTVHRPDVVFENHIIPDADGNAQHQGDKDSWSSLVFPGQCFAMEYGWSASEGVKNGILNGDGFSDSRSGILIPGREQIRFVVTTYTFSIESDNQIKFRITGYEMGEFNLRQAFIVKDEENDRRPKQAVNQKRELDPYSGSSEALKKLLKKVQDQVADEDSSRKEGKKGGKVVQFGKLFDVVFAPAIKQAYAELGFDVAGIFLGRFNDRVGVPAKKYGAGRDMSGQPISEFTFPLDNVEKVFRELLKAGDRLTVYNFLLPFVRKFNDSSIWDRKGEPNFSERTVPEMTIRSITRKKRNGKMEISFYIFDMHREYSKFSKDDGQKNPNGKSKPSREELRQAVVAKGVPYVSMVRGNSYIRDTNFSVIQNEDMKGIFIRRALGKEDLTRAQKTTQPDLAQKEGRTPAAQQIFAPTITGNITMVGNFVFDVFNLIWLDFGIQQWDGPFNIMEREDTIERGSFTTTVKVFAAPTDPLNVLR